MIITNNSAVQTPYSVKKTAKTNNSSQKLTFGSSKVDKVMDFTLKNIYEKKKFLFIPYKKLNRAALNENSEKLDKMLGDNKFFDVMVDASKKIHEDVVRPITTYTEHPSYPYGPVVSTAHPMSLHSNNQKLGDVTNQRDAKGLKKIMVKYMKYKKEDVHSKSIDVINEALKGAQKSLNTEV